MYRIWFVSEKVKCLVENKITKKKYETETKENKMSIYEENETKKGELG